MRTLLDIEGAIARAREMLDDPAIVALAEARYAAGQETFGDAWLTRPMDWFDREAREEAADLLVYLAMEAWRESAPYGDIRARATVREQQ